MVDTEKEGLEQLVKREELLEKKTKIYSRILTDAALAKSLEELSIRHGKRKQELCALLTGKEIEKSQEGQK